MNAEDIIVWADSTWCYRHELSFMGWKSDDYEVVFYGSGVYYLLTLHADM
jgi:hypothetical protein